MSHRPRNQLPLRTEVRKAFRVQLAAAERAKREGRPVPQVYAPRTKDRSTPERRDDLFDESTGDWDEGEEYNHQIGSVDRRRHHIRTDDTPVETNLEETNNLEVQEAALVQSTSASSGRLSPSSCGDEGLDQIPGMVGDRSSYSGKRFPGQSLCLPGQEGLRGQEEHQGRQDSPIVEDHGTQEEPHGQKVPSGQSATNAPDASRNSETTTSDTSHQQDEDASNERLRHVRTPGTFPEGQGEDVPIATPEPECERCQWMNERAGLGNLRIEDIECSWADTSIKTDGFAGTECEWRIYYIKTRQDRDMADHVNIWPPSMKDRVCRKRKAAELIESPVVTKRRRIDGFRF